MSMAESVPETYRPEPYRPEAYRPEAYRSGSGLQEPAAREESTVPGATGLPMDVPKTGRRRRRPRRDSKRDRDRGRRGGGGTTRDDRARYALDDLVRSALSASSGASRGVNRCDRRFRWHVLSRAEDRDLDRDRERDGSLSETNSDVNANSDANSDANSGVNSDANSGVNSEEFFVDEKAETGIASGVAAREPPTRAEDPHDSALATIFEDGAVPRALVSAVQDRVAERTGARAKVVLSGSTGARITAVSAGAPRATVAAAFPTSDIDIEVCVDPTTAIVARGDVSLERVLEAARAGVEAACVDIVADVYLESRVARALESCGLGVDRARANSRVYIRNESGDLVSVDVPRFSSSAPRLRHSIVFATRNDTMPGGLSLHRIRAAFRRPDGSLRSVSMMDIKTSVRAPERTVPRVEWGLRLYVPCPGAASDELERMLSRTYENVDSSKDERRAAQAKVLTALDRRGKRTFKGA